MSNGANNVTVSFRASGGNLSNYIDEVKGKNKSMYDAAAASINQQTAKTKEQNKLIEQQIALLTKKSQIELQAERNILAERRKREISLSSSSYDTKADAVYNNTRLTEAERDRRLKAIERDRKNDEGYIRNKYRDLMDDNTAETRGLSVARRLQQQKDAEAKRLTAEEVLKRKEAYGTGNPDFSLAPENLQSYINRRQNKSNTALNDTLSKTKAENKEGREWLSIIEKQVTALAKKTREETNAAQNILQMRRNGLLRSNANYFNRERDAVNGDTSLDSVQKAIRLEAISGAEKDRADNIKARYGESLTSTKEQERQSKLQTTLAKEQIETIKQKAAENVKAIQSGDLKLSDVFKSATTDQEKLIAQLTREGVRADQRQPGTSASVMKAFGLNMLTQSAMGYIGTQNQNALSVNGFDVIGNQQNLMAKIVGGLIGGIIGGVASGGTAAILGAGIGSEIVGTWSTGLTEQQKKQAITRQEFDREYFKYRGLTGHYADIMRMPDMQGVGVSGKQYLQNISEYAKRRGYMPGSAQTATDALYLEKGYGVDQPSSAAIVEMQRSAKAENRSLANLVGGILERGKNTYFKDGDTSFLNEFLNKFISLQKQLLNNQTTVATGTTFDLLSRFNRVGGAFATSDPRSGGLMSTINGAISNPSGDFSRALTMYAIRKANPNISNPLEMMIQMQKGLAGGNLQSIYDVINQSSGSEWEKTIGLARVTGLGGQMAFGKDLYGGLKSGIFKGKLNGSELNAAIPGLREQAEGNTAPIDKNAARNENAWLTDKPVVEIGKSISDAVKVSLEGSVIKLENGYLLIKSPERRKTENTTKKAQDQETQKQRTDQFNDSYFGTRGYK